MGHQRHQQILRRHVARELSRRRLLGLSARAGLGGLLAASLPAGLLGCPAPTEDSAAPEDTGLPSGDAVVGIGAGDSVVACAERALAMAGGLSFLEPGQSVFLKLNGVSSDPYPSTTSPELLVWLVQQLQAAGAGTITAGDSPWLMAEDDALQACGLQAAADQAGIELLDFRTEQDWVTIPSDEAPDWPSEMRLPAALLAADHIINLPTLKTHVVTGVTLALKLLVGATHPEDREASMGPHDERIDRQIAQINAHVTPTLSILDGFEACVNGGPFPQAGFDQRRLGLCLASRDRVALDVCGLAVLRQHTDEPRLLGLASPWQLEGIVEAVALGLGRGALTERDIGSTGVDADTMAALLADVVR